MAIRQCRNVMRFTRRRLVAFCNRRRCLIVAIVGVVMLRIAGVDQLSSPQPSGMSGLVGQSLIDYLGTHLRVTYVRSASGGSDVVLTNSGPLDIPPGARTTVWSIYFSHATYDRLDTFHGQDVARRLRLSLAHIDGWLYRLQTILSNVPNDAFGGLPSGRNVTLVKRIKIKSLSYAFPRWYVVGDSSTEPRVIANTDTETTNFVQSFDEENDDFLANRRHAYNLETAAAPPKPIIPTPLRVGPTEARQVHIDSDWRVAYDGEQLRNEAVFIASKLNLTTGKAVAKDSARVIQLQVESTLNISQLAGSNHPLSESEGYVLEVLAARQRVVVSGLSTAGVFYGLQSLLSLLDNNRTLPEVRVVDAPRVAYRAVMIDVARNFLDKHFIFRLLDVMAMYKMNTLHLHLTDDQGWRLEVPTLPELTDIGSRRSHDPSQNSSLLPYFGSAPHDSRDAKSRYYSVSDYRDILRRAAELHVQVIPEIDMPGHMHAAIQSMRVRTERLKNRGFSSVGQEFQLSIPEDKYSSYLAVNDQRDTVINPCLNSTYRFVELIMNHLISLHKDIQPLRVLHLGADEVPQDALKHSSVCRHLLVDSSNAGVVLRLHFMRLAVDIAARLGVNTVQVWKVGVADVYNKPVNRSQWHSGVKMRVNVWHGSKGFRMSDFADAGYQVILSHANHMYLDHPYEHDSREPGLSWATTNVDTRDVFNYHLPPASHASGVLPQLRRRLCDLYGEERKGCPSLQRPENVIGVEACLWTEMVRTADRADYMLYPRLLAVAERAWHAADWETTVDQKVSDRARQRDWAQFAAALGHRELRRLDQLGINYRLPPPGVMYNSAGKFEVNAEFPGLGVKYSMDGGHSWSSIPSSLSSASQSATYQFITRSPDGRRMSRPVRMRPRIN